jgi:hypothetical protein
MYPDSEILFPTRCIPILRDLRGDEWRDLVQRVVKRAEDHEDTLGFSLMMIRLGGCLTCDLDSYRASLGCATCSKRTVAGFKGTDKALIKKFNESCKEVGAYTGENSKKNRQKKKKAAR